MTSKVQGYKYIEKPSFITDVKTNLKYVFIRLLWELFDAEKQADNFQFTINEGSRGLQIINQYPDIGDTLPVITVSFSGLDFTKPLVNDYMTPYHTKEVDDMLGDHSEPGYRSWVRLENGMITFAVTALSDTQRDAIIDRVVDYFIWNQNNAGIDIPQYLMDRGLVLRDDRWALSGDQEIKLEDKDLIFVDGVSFSLYGEIYGPKKPAILVEDIEFITEIIRPGESG